jgi:hypothetical protein
VAIELALCEFCNPLELAQPAASQAHGVAVLGVFVAVVILAIAAYASVSGIGPFRAEVAGVSAAPDGLSVTIQVTNEGTKASQSTCRVFRRSDRGIGSNAVVTSPRIEPGATLAFSATIRELGTRVVAPGEMGVDCPSP